MRFKKGLLALFLAIGAVLFPACNAGGNENSDSNGNGGNDAVTHVDVNADGVCDQCNTSVVVTIDVLAVNDLHGKFLDTDAQPGVDEMSAYVKKVRAENPNTILLSSGDMWQGSPESNLTRGKLVTEWMNEMDFTSMTLGNHEYDWGEEYIESNATLADFPFLGINVIDTDTRQRAEYCEASLVVELGGAKIGIIGAEGDVHSSIAADYAKGVTFKTGMALTNLVIEESTRLREEEGVDFVIYSIHDGKNSDYDHYNEALSSGGFVDLVFEAHTHAQEKYADDYGVWHIQGGGDNRNGLSHAQIKVNFANSNGEVEKVGFVKHNDYASLQGDSVVQTLTEKYATEIASAYEVLGINSTVKYESEILNAVAQAYYEAGAKKWKDKQIVLGGGYMNVRAPYFLKTGTITYGDLINLLPFDNELVLCSIRGSDLKKNFINADKKNYYISYTSYGNSIKDNIVDSQTYYIVTDTYSSTYAPNKLTEIERMGGAPYARDLYAEYLKNTLPQPSTGGDTSGGDTSGGGTSGGGTSGGDTSGGGTTDNPATTTPQFISISAALALGESLGENVSTTEKYRVQGKIIEIEPVYSNGIHYGNMTIEDLNGNQLYIYGTYDTEGNRYGDMQNKPQVGDYVTLEKEIMHYVSANKDMVQMKYATIISFETIKTVAEALAIGNALGEKEYTPVLYAVFGTVESITSPEKYGNITLIDGEGNALTLYGTYDMEGNRYGNMENKPQVGDQIMVVGKIYKYVNDAGTTMKIEIENAIVREIA